MNRKSKREKLTLSGVPRGHEKCNYYILDLDHDEFAESALLEYARVCRDKFPKLAASINKEVCGKIRKDTYLDGKCPHCESK